MAHYPGQIDKQQHPPVSRDKKSENEAIRLMANQKRISKRRLLHLAAFLAPSCCIARGGHTQNSRPLLGAIRWDAWYSPGSVPTTAVENSLAPLQYQWRFPFFVNRDASDPAKIDLPALSQDLMDLEIKQAIYAGLDFWAFVGYGQGNPMSTALDRYLASSIRTLRFCMFTQLEYWGSRNRPSELISYHAELMKDPRYVRTSDGRPIYFLGFVSRRKVEKLWGGYGGLRDQIEDFRRNVQQLGAEKPYIVVAGANSEASDWKSLGVDALSAYAIAAGKGAQSFSSLARVAEDGWNVLAASGLPVIPTAMAGWDRRPRIEHPVPWKAQKTGVGMEDFFLPPTVDELASHIRSAMHFALSQGTSIPAVLIYAWNENDEGGWLIPTTPCQSDHLRAVRKAVDAQPANDPGCSLKNPK